MKKIKFNVNAQANVLMRQANVDDKLFFDFVRTNGVPIGSAMVLEYLLIRDGRSRPPNENPRPREVFIDVK